MTRGDPESPLRWTSKSTRRLAEELGTQGYPVSPQKVGQLLHASGYSLQATQKTLEGTAHPDRNEQFEYLNDRVDAFQTRGAPVIAVDTKKKELVGDVLAAPRHKERFVYVGPAIGRGFFRDDCLHVIVEQTSTDRGFVITAVMRKALVEDGPSGSAPAQAP